MERIRPKKLFKVDAPPHLPPAVSPVMKPRPLERVIASDPACRPRYDLDGYSAPKLIFRTGAVPVSARIKKFVDDELNESRVYYAGQVLLGSASIGPLQVVGRFNHNLAGMENMRFKDTKELHNKIREMLQAEPKDE